MLTEVERKISDFVSSIDGVYRSYDVSKFFVVFEAARLAELERQRKVYHWGKENWKFIPHPATWLNQRRWEDETIAAEDDIPDDDPYGAFVY